MAFVIEKVVKLDDLGEGWKGAEIVLSSLSFRESEELASLEVDPNDPNAKGNRESFKTVIDLMGKKFVRGTAFNGEGLVPLESTDLADLPVEIVNLLIKALVGTVSPN